MKLDIDQLKNDINESVTTQVSGYVQEVVGLVIHATSIIAPIGSFCEINTNNNNVIFAGIVGFKGNSTLLMSYGTLDGISQNDKITVLETNQTIGVGDHLLGRILNGLGEPIDEKEELTSVKKVNLYNDAPDPLKRPRITEPLSLGLRAIDGMLTIGKGQRFGIFAGTGVGKSVIIGMIAKYSKADIIIIALVGERGREVREFLDKDLGKEALKRSVVIVSTSDKPALQRVRSVFVATSIAEYFRDQGKDVLLIMDSITRAAMAQREIGLSVGEPPATKGYPPSVFSMMPKFLERAGRNEHGSITGVYTVLLEGDDVNDPIGDAARGILDGHVVLSRDLAAKGHYPAIDILNSISRVSPQIVSSNVLESQQRIRSLLASYKEAEDLINIGAYVTGSNKNIDKAIEMNQSINNFLIQSMNENADLTESIKQIQVLGTIAKS
ncbi:MAG: EscN/YscN/HrcN family type III secretion system ATPase [Planctomycetota bacterium]|nr:MAG: EscN/YscN/HrcN family type III secretion system ATPase [Planctomycetota bacterium]